MVWWMGGGLCSLFYHFQLLFRLVEMETSCNRVGKIASTEMIVNYEEKYLMQFQVYEFLRVESFADPFKLVDSQLVITIRLIHT